MKAKEVMTTDVHTITQSTNLIDAIILLIEKSVAGIPICDDNGKLTGIITEKDMLDLLNMGKVTSEMKVSDFSSVDVKSIAPEDDLTDVAKTFLENNFRMVPVCDNKKLVGVVSRRDIIRTILSDAFGVEI